MQNSLLYYPGAHLPSPDQLAADGLQFWPSGPPAYRGFISAARGSKGKGTIVVFHGNAGTASDRIFYSEALARLGYRVILAEYPGYGARKGALGEASFVSDAKEILRLASEKYGQPMYVLGESLGCGVAAAVVNEPPVKIEAVILITPWDTLLSVAKEKFPWLPVSLLLRDKYDSVGNLKAFRGKIAVIGAERDQVIPIWHARALYASLPGDKKIWTIKSAGHNDWPDVVDQAWWKEITDFIRGE